MLAETVTTPWTLVCLAVGGYTSRVEEINFGSLTVLAAETGASAGADGGAAGGLEVRPAEVSNPAGVDPPTASVEAISVKGVVPSLGLIVLCFGALGEPIFKFGITGLREEERSGCLGATDFFSCRWTIRCSGRDCVRESEVAGLVTRAGTGATAATGCACSTATVCAGVWGRVWVSVWVVAWADSSFGAWTGSGAFFAVCGSGVDG
jgi:hypothetical protein